MSTKHMVIAWGGRKKGEDRGRGGREKGEDRGRGGREKTSPGTPGYWLQAC